MFILDSFVIWEIATHIHTRAYMYIYCVGAWKGFRAGLDVMPKSKSLSCEMMPKARPKPSSL